MPDRSAALKNEQNRGQTTIAPVLMCPDDCDFWCTIIVAEVERTANQVGWKRIGIDKGYIGGNPDSIGIQVSWYDLPQYTFDIRDYEKCMGTFKKELI